MTGRLDAEAWVEAGLAFLRDEGEGALRLERLCQRLGRTKGSFYHHFPDLDALARAMLARWREAHTAELIAATRAVAPRRRRAALSRLALGLDWRLELAMRAWALRNEEARAAVEAVDAERLAYLASLWGSMGVRRGARDLARLEYAAFLGFLQLSPPRGQAAIRAFNRNLELALRALAHPGDRGGR